MRRRGKCQPPIGQKHRRRAAEHDRSKPSPAETIDRPALRKHERQHSESRDAETQRGNIPRRETAAAQPKPRHHDPAGPDADRGQPIGRAAQILAEVARLWHQPFSIFHNLSNLLYKVTWQTVPRQAECMAKEHWTIRLEWRPSGARFRQYARRAAVAEADRESGELPGPCWLRRTRRADRTCAGESFAWAFWRCTCPRRATRPKAA